VIHRSPEVRTHVVCYNEPFTKRAIKLSKICMGDTVWEIQVFLNMKTKICIY